MAHELTAEVWRHLRCTPGLDAAMLRHLTKLLYEAPSWAPRETLQFRIHFICWAKTIIDHQRARLQSTDGLAAMPVPIVLCTVVSQDLIFVTLSALVMIKRRLFPPSSTTASAHICCRIYNLATIVCGLRLLSLHNKAVSKAKLAELVRDINSNWKHPQLVPVEQFLLFELIPDLVRRLSALPSSQPTRGRHQTLGIPAYDDLTNLHIQKSQASLCSGCKKPTIRTSSVKCADHYWRLFDTLGAVDAALIQCFNEDGAKPINAIAGWTTGEDRLYNVVQTRSGVLDDIYSAPTHHQDGPARISLAASLSSWDYAAPARKDEPAASSFEIKAGPDVRFTTSAGTFLHDSAPYIKDALRSLLVCMRDLGSELPRPDSPLLPHAKMPTVMNTDAITKTEKIVSGLAAPLLTPDAEAFTFTTSGQHLLVWDKAMKGVLKIEVNAAFGPDVVESRDYLWVGSDVLVAAGGSDVIAVLTNTGSEAAHAEDEGHMQRTGSIQVHKIEFYRRDSLFESVVVGRAAPVDPRMTSIVVNRTDSLVGLCLNGTISVFEVGPHGCHQLAFDDRLELYRNISKKRISDSRSTSRLSRRLSTRLSLGSPGSSAADSDPHKEADVPARIRERMVSLSPTKDHFVVATLLSDDHVYIDVFKYYSHSITIATSHTSILAMPPPLLADNGLTAAFINLEAMEAVFVADVGRAYTVHVPLAPHAGDLVTDTEGYGKQVICAAQSSDGRRYVMINGLGEMLSMTYKSAALVSAKEVRYLRKAGSGLPGGLKNGDAAVVMLDGGRAVVAWRSGVGKLMMRVVQLQNEVCKDYALN